jgi:hypothetical protein
MGVPSKIIMKIDGNKVLGYMKYQTKKLFYRNKQGKNLEISPICVMV